MINFVIRYAEMIGVLSKIVLEDSQFIEEFNTAGTSDNVDNADNAESSHSHKRAKSEENL
jgi:hypothetical protein